MKTKGKYFRYMPGTGLKKAVFSLLAFFILFTFLISCEKENELYRGEIWLSSQFDFQDASVMGFNFELGSGMEYPSPGEPLPDIVVDQFRRIDGSIKPGFSSPANPNGFSLAGEFDNLKSSEEFYKNELTSYDTTVTFSPSSDTVEKFQVWVLKTTLNKYVKLHVRQTRIIPDPNGEHAEVLIDYYFQPNGSARFPD